MNDVKHNTKHEEHDDSEGHEHHSSRSYRMRLPSPLTPEAERVMSETIGCAIQVHRELGPGLLESIYRSAMQIELAEKGLSHEIERPVCIRYRDSSHQLPRAGASERTENGVVRDPNSPSRPSFTSRPSCLWF